MQEQYGQAMRAYLRLSRAKHTGALGNQAVARSADIVDLGGTDAKRILWAAQDITENRPPLSRWHPDFADPFADWLKS